MNLSTEVGKPMKFIGEHQGVKYYWSDPANFVIGGVYYWDGNQNVHLEPPAPLKEVSTLTDADVNDITMNYVGKWPSFEAQSWACKVTHAVLNRVYKENPFDRVAKDTGPWTAGVNKNDKRVFVESDDFKHDVRLYVDGDFASPEDKLAYAEGVAKQLNGEADTAIETFLRELTQYAPTPGRIVAPTALMGIGMKALRMLRRMVKD